MFVSEVKIEFRISGMHCAGCASRLEDALRKLSGVRSASVNFATASAVLVRDKVVSSIDGGTPEKVFEESVRSAVEREGFSVAEVITPAMDSLAQNRPPMDDDSGWGWILALIGFLPLAIVSMGEHFFAVHRAETGLSNRLVIESVVSGLVVFGAGRPILAGAVAAFVFRPM